MEKYQDSPNFDCHVKPGAGVARMGRHTDQERRSRDRAGSGGRPGHWDGLHRRKVAGVGFMEVLEGWYRLPALVTCC